MIANEAVTFRQRRMKMTANEQIQEMNFQEYQRLLQDSQYEEVQFDEKSGGVSAIHKEHKFDKQLGNFGVRRGVYELLAMDTLREQGHVVILESEQAPNGVKTPDGYIDGESMDIKAVENIGQWTIKNKFHNATKQGVETLILYFHLGAIYSADTIEDGWNKYIKDIDSLRYERTIKKVLCIVEGEEIQWVPPK
ncbi:MAG: hypothetical protein IJQ96_04860 [Bacteroidales bacterium]|nr:hypothetical protein [Bacteroidales bacterium]